jgi:hypothetical protein
VTTRGRLALAATLLCSLSSSVALAASRPPVTTLVSVYATVTSNCRISTSALNFGTYDPLVRNRNRADVRDSTQNVFCTKGVTPLIEIESMSDLVQDGSQPTTTLAYSAELFEPVPAPGTEPVSTSDGTGFAYILRGTLAAGQDAPVGHYHGSLTLRVNF